MALGCGHKAATSTTYSGRSAIVRKWMDRSVFNGGNIFKSTSV
jgi:hypothetical protein